MILSIPELSERNPWWVDKKRINDDRHIVEAENSGIDWKPNVFAVEDLQTDAIYTLRGPRQVGKTTHIKFLIKTLLEMVNEPRSILYLSCDPINNRDELWKTLVEYLRWIKDITGDRVFIFLDEVTLIRDWQITIKDLYDSGLLKNCTLVATGSHSLDVIKGGEQLPGRRGRYKPPADREMLPMDFPNFVRAYDKELYYQIMNSTKKAKDLKQEIVSIQMHLANLSKLFDKYLLTGGFPKPISEYKKTNEKKIEVYPYDDMIFYLRGDIIKIGKNPEIAEKILSTIIEKMGTPIGYNTIATEIEVDQKTAKEYVETLQAMYILDIIHQPDIKKWKPQEKKRKKIYTKDPFILHVSKYLTNRETDPFEQAIKTVKEKQAEILEEIIVNHAKRYTKETFFWRSKKGKEIDVLIKTPTSIIGIEVKTNIEKAKTTQTEKRIQAIPHEGEKITIITGRGERTEINEKEAKIPIEILLFTLKKLVEKRTL